MSPTCTNYGDRILAKASIGGHFCPSAAFGLEPEDRGMTPCPHLRGNQNVYFQFRVHPHTRVLHPDLNRESNTKVSDCTIPQRPFLKERQSYEKTNSGHSPDCCVRIRTENPTRKY